jgi:hypothetical protein
MGRSTASDIAKAYKRDGIFGAAGAAAAAVAGGKGLGKLGKLGKAEKAIEGTSRAARRQAMRETKIPTSQQPVSQRGSAGHRQYEYEVHTREGKKTAVVTHHPADAKHPQPHWHAGPAKEPPRLNRQGTLKYKSGGSKVQYKGRH